MARFRRKWTECEVLAVASTRIPLLKLLSQQVEATVSLPNRGAYETLAAVLELKVETLKRHLSQGEKAGELVLVRTGNTLSVRLSDWGVELLRGTPGPGSGVVPPNAMRRSRLGRPPGGPRRVRQDVISDDAIRLLPDNCDGLELRLMAWLLDFPGYLIAGDLGEVVAVVARGLGIGEGLANKVLRTLQQKRLLLRLSDTESAVTIGFRLANLQLEMPWRRPMSEQARFLVGSRAERSGAS